MARILAIDYGRARTGVAMCDPMEVLASPLETYTGGQAVDRIAALVQAEAVALILVGMPLEMSGDKGAQAEEVDQFIDRLRAAVRRRKEGEPSGAAPLDGCNYGVTPRLLACVGPPPPGIRNQAVKAAVAKVKGGMAVMADVAAARVVVSKLSNPKPSADVMIKRLTRKLSADRQQYIK